MRTFRIQMIDGIAFYRAGKDMQEIIEWVRHESLYYVKDIAKIEEVKA